MTSLSTQLKQMIIDVLALEDISVDDINDESPLFNEGLGLDSIDALELGLALKKRYNIHLNAESEDTKKYFQSINTLVELVEQKGKC